MPKSRQRKNHKNKVNLRNIKIQNDKKKIEKIQREFINNLIEEEKKKGLFNNNVNMSLDGDVSVDGPTI